MNIVAKHFLITVSGDVIVNLDDIWPEGAPEDPTPAQVLAKLKEDYGDRPREIALQLGIELNVVVERGGCRCRGLEHRRDCKFWEMCL